MKKRFVPLIAAFVAVLTPAPAEIPNTIPHQGRVVVGNSNYHGSGDFKFLLFEDDDRDHTNGGEVGLWANDSNNGVPFAEPVSSVSISVRRGLYATQLGDANLMTPLPDSIEPSAGKKLYLRIWFDGGTGSFQVLSPDIQFGAVPLALHTRSVTPGGVDSSAIADGAVTNAKIAKGAVTMLGSPDGMIDEAVSVTDDGTLGVGTSLPKAGLHVVTSSEVLVPRHVTTLIDDESGFDALAGAVGIASSGTLIAVASRLDDSVSLIDITNPSSPFLRSVMTDGIGGFNHLNGAVSVAFNGDFLAIGAYDDDSVLIIDATDPDNPVLKNVISDGVNGFDHLDGVLDVEWHLNRVVVASELDDSVTLIGNPASTPILLVAMKDGQSGFNHLDGARAIAVNEDMIAVAAYEDDSVSLIDISAPRNPELEEVMTDGVGSFSELDGAAAVNFSGDLLAIGAAEDHAVSLVDTGSLTGPVANLMATLKDGVGAYHSLAGTRAVAFNGDFLVAAGSFDDALTFIDTTDPENPVFKGAIRNGEGPFNALEGARDLVFAETAPSILAVVSMVDDAVTLLNTAGSGSAGIVVDDWLGVGTLTPQAALHVNGGLIVDHNDGLVDLGANHVEVGVGNTASGTATFASGKSTTASGDFATAMGRNTEASGNYSLALGRGTVAPSAYEMAIGRFNTDYTPSSEEMWLDQDRLFVIGNGTSLTSRSDLLTLFKNGYLELDGRLEITGSFETNSDIICDGQVTADSLEVTGDYEYDTLKTCHHQTTGAAFSPHRDDVSYWRSSDEISPANDTILIGLFADVHLPDGATVTKVEFAYKDLASDADYDGSSFYLKRQEFGVITGGGNLASITNISTSGSQAIVHIASDDSIADAVIDNQRYRYWLYASLRVTDARSGQLTFDGARITYTTSKVSN